jgi:tetratricopeptide (TPR) repeat protein
VIGEILGNRYKLLRELGAGGMAWVYLGEDLLDNVQVAVKILYPQFSRDMSYVERFRREAKVAQEISSEHIVRILHYGADRDVYYLVMELIEGKDLSTVLRERGQLPWKEALQITAQVASALDAANEHGVVHRDIKPQNIMITPDGIVKVLDFGIARARKMSSLTQTGFVGSPYYISPEQAMGEDVDVRSDIYSLGVALYEMLSGKLPFDASSPWSIISQHIAQKPPTLTLENSGLSTRIESVVNRMMAKDPDDRYQTPKLLLQSLEAARQGKDTGDLDPAEVVQVHRSIPLSRAHKLLLSSLYDRAVEAEGETEWHQAVNLFNRIVKIAPDYQDVRERLAHAGRQARLAALYTAAQAAFEEKRLEEAIDELSEIVSVDANYCKAAELLTQAGMALAEIKAQERIAELYERGLVFYQHREWQEADDCFTQVLEIDPNHKDIANLYADAHRRARWSSSLLGRVGHRLAGLVNTSETEHASESAQEGEQYE